MFELELWVAWVGLVLTAKECALRTLILGNKAAAALQLLRAIHAQACAAVLLGASKEIVERDEPLRRLASNVHQHRRPRRPQPPGI